MAVFKTKQFIAMSHIIRGFADNENTDCEQLNSFVNTLVVQFAIDNKLFNEKLFRYGCGERISQICIIVETGVKTNEQLQRKYNGRFI